MWPLVQFERWLHAPAPAQRLAGLRIATGGFVTIYLALHSREFSRLTRRSTSEFEPVGLARLLSEPISDVLLWVGYAALLVTGTCFTVGIAARLAAPLFAFLVLGWTSYHSSWGQVLHFEHLFTIHVLILAMAPSADAWAIGQRRNLVDTPRPHVRYGWPIRLMAIATVLTYALAGIAKLKRAGWAWFETETLATHIGYSSARTQIIGGDNPPLAQIVLDNQWLITPMAGAALAVELGALVALFGKRTRTVWVIAAMGFHTATAATMLVYFGYRGLGIAMLPLFAVEQAPAKFRAILARATG